MREELLAFPQMRQRSQAGSGVVTPAARCDHAVWSAPVAERAVRRCENRPFFVS